MKDKRPIETQVAELTPEQKKTIRRVGISYDIIMCVVVIAYLVVALFFMAQMNATNEKIENFSFYKTVEVDGQTRTEYDATAYDAYVDLVTRQEQTMTDFVTIAGIGFVAVLLIMGVGLLIIAVKFPYYSDKRFVYIGRMNRRAKQK